MTAKGAEPYADLADQYVDDVTAGATPACKWVRLACERHLRERETSEVYEYDRALGDRACAFVEMMPHTKGRWARNRERIVLEPWQAFVICMAFGWVHRETRRRRFRVVYIEVPRKNAKSTILAAIALYMLIADDEPGAECYSAATTRDQARIVFTTAQQMARASPDMCMRFGVAVQAHNINVIATQSKLEALSADGHTLDGLNISFAAVDELHAHKSRSVWDVIETAIGARDQPLIWAITTAGSDRSGICYEQRSYLQKVLNGAVDDPSYFGVIYTIDDDDDWRDETAWRKANPNYDVSVDGAEIARLCRKAQELSSAQNNFLTKHLDVWVNADEAWMNMLAWDKQADPSLSLEQFEGDPCWVGIDLASKIDLAALVILFRRTVAETFHYYLFGRYWLPEETIETSINSQYSGWARSGKLTATAGQVIDFEYIERELDGLASRFEIREVAYDPFQATQFSTRMIERGLPMVECRPTVLNFSEPMKELESLTLDGRLHHDGDPVLGWSVSNVVCHYDAKDNVYPRKETIHNKIDPVIAAIMALARANVDLERRSVYEGRGLITL